MHFCRLSLTARSKEIHTLLLLLMIMMLLLFLLLLLVMIMYCWWGQVTTAAMIMIGLFYCLKYVTYTVKHFLQNCRDVYGTLRQLLWIRPTMSHTCNIYVPCHIRSDKTIMIPLEGKYAVWGILHGVCVNTVLNFPMAE